MTIVAVFMISVIATAKVVQRQNFSSSLIRKTEESRKLTDDPKTYQKKKNFINLVIGQISGLKNGNFHTMFVDLFSVYFFACFCVLIVINVY